MTADPLQILMDALRSVWPQADTTSLAAVADQLMRTHSATFGTSTASLTFGQDNDFRDATVTIGNIAGGHIITFNITLPPEPSIPHRSWIERLWQALLQFCRQRPRYIVLGIVFAVIASALLTNRTQSVRNMTMALQISNRIRDSLTQTVPLGIIQMIPLVETGPEIAVTTVHPTTTTLWLAMQKPDKHPYGVISLPRKLGPTPCLYQYFQGLQSCRTTPPIVESTELVSAMWAEDAGLWVAVQGQGVVYGTIMGPTTIVFTPFLTLRDLNEEVMSIYRDTDARLWVGSTQGLYRVDHSGRMTEDSDQLRSACGLAPREPITVRDITGDADTVWMATTSGLIQWSFLDDMLTCYRSTDSVACPTRGRLGSGSLWSVARFPGEGIAVGSSQGEISMLSEQALQENSRCWQTVTLTTPIPGLLPKRVHDLARHNDGMLLAATDGGLYYRLTPSEPWHRYDIPHGTGEVIRIFDFVAGTPPCMYVGTANGLYGIQC